MKKLFVIAVALSATAAFAQSPAVASASPAATASALSSSPPGSTSWGAGDFEAQVLPEEHLYPVVWHDHAGGWGPRAWVWCGDAVRCVSVVFADPRDEMNYRALSFRVKNQAQDPNFAEQYVAPPAVCFSGHFEAGTDAWNRPLLRVSNWFVMPPFFRLNAEMDVVVDYAESEKRMQLDASDFDSRPGRTLHGVSLQKYVKSSGQREAFTYPVADADPQRRTVTLLTHRSSEAASGQGLEPVCFTAAAVFADAAQAEHFFSPENVERVKRARAEGCGAALMLTGIYRPADGRIQALDFALGDVLAAEPAAPAPSLDERLLAAARAGDAACARRLLASGAKVNACDRLLRETPLHLAAGGGHAELVRLLLEAGADVRAKDACGGTPLHWAAACGSVCVDEPDSDEARAAAARGAAASDAAAVAQRVEALRLLLEAGADVNAADRSGITPLQRAAAVGYADVLRELLAQGADVNARRQQNPTALSSGPKSALEAARRFGRSDSERILKEAGAEEP